MTGNQIIVMIVDDDDSIRKAVRRLMKSYGFAVETFASVEEFLGSDRLAKTSCLILDIHMPGMNGLELQKRLVASGSVVPIIFITAFTDDRARAEAMLIVFTRCWSMPELMFRSLRRGESSSFDVAKREEQSAPVAQPGALHAPPSPKTGRTMQSKGSPVRIVYIVDDDPALLGSLERTFRAAGLTALSYQAAFAFLDAAPGLSDGCLLLDIVMPEMDGLQLQERLNSLGFNMPVIVMTAWGDVETAVQAMKNGALDFIEKPFNDEALFDAINAAFALDRGPTRDRESVVASKLMAKLSPRERQVLDGLVGGRSTKQIAYDPGISARTVEVHRARMLARLGTNSLAEAIRLAVLAGLPPADLEANAADRQRLSGTSRRLPE